MDHVIRKIISKPSDCYFILDPCLWVDEDEFEQRARENGINKIISEGMDLKYNIEEGLRKAYHFQNVQNINIPNIRKQYEIVSIDLQPLTIFPTLDPTISSYLTPSQVEELFESYGFKEGSVSGERSSIKILMKELHDIDIERLSDRDYLLGECIRLMASGNIVPRYWIDRISDNIADLGVPEKSTLFNDPEILSGLLNEESLTGNLTGYLDLMKKIVSIQTTDEGIQVDIDAISSNIKAINWTDLHLNDWADRWRDLALLGIAKEYDKSGDMERLNLQINEIFIEILDEEYDQLQQLSWIKRPPLIWKINDYINHHNKDERVLLLVVDCLSLPMWEVINTELKKMDIIPELETATITWVPTLTCICRQSILSGLRPLDFKDTFKTTSAEKRLWKEYWEKRGISNYQVEYQVKVEKDLEGAYKVLQEEDIIRTAFIVNSVDDLVHASGDISNFSWENMIDFIKNNMIGEIISPIIRKAIDNDWTVYLTSDHGNHKIFRKSQDKRDGVLTELKGQRCKIFEDKNLVMSNQSKRIFEPTNVFPEGYVVISSEYGSSFGTSNGWGHGGISWDEMIVPFVRYGGKRS